MWARYALFIVLSLGILFANYWIMSRFGPKREAPAPAAQQVAEAPEKAKAVAKEKEAAKPGQQEKAPAEAIAQKAPEPPAAAEAKVPNRWVALGSADPGSPYRMLVTLTNHGAAVKRIELNSERFHDAEQSGGYLGHVVMDEGAGGTGVPVQVVGEGTPAAKAGLKAGDVIQAIDGKQVAGFDSFQAALAKTKPGQTVTLAVQRQGGAIELPVALERRPLQVVRPEGNAPPSFLMRLYRIDDVTLAPKEGEDEAVAADLDKELEGANLRTANWEVVSQDATHVKFRRLLPKYGLEVVKSFELAKVPENAERDSNYPAYHLTYDVEIRNTGTAARKIAYEIDGPNGLPKDGWWYASKVSRNWSGAGLRDVLVSFNGNAPEQLAAAQIGEDKWPSLLRRDEPMTYIGVDAQYFSVVLIPQREDPNEPWFSGWQPLHYGKPEKDRLNLTNTSFRVISTLHEVKPADAIKEQFLVFAGPKKPDLLAQARYGLGNFLYYGWFKWAAIPMLWILHGVYYLIPNYGIAIILLTVLVRLAMFPVSRKQAMNAQKMQELQPEIKRIQEKYKNNLEARGKAQQELFKKHNYNPAGGCLLVFLQLPIFVGLYRALMVDVELYQAPLITQAIRWASNLAAPDMLFDWSGFMPAFISGGVGMFGLGPYFNLFPVISIILFLWQQKRMMPPPTDEQSAMQQKIMQYMMIFMGILFFKVASGLCLYFIASSLWGMGERKFLPKTSLATAGTTTPAKTEPRTILPWGGKPDGRDGASSRKNRKKSGRR